MSTIENLTRSVKKFQKRISSGAKEVHLTITPMKKRSNKGLFDNLDASLASEKSERIPEEFQHEPNVISIPKSQVPTFGLDCLRMQLHRKLCRSPLPFTVMVAGKSGLGKSTFINSLFLTDIYSADYPGPSKRPNQTSSVESNSVVLSEGDISINLTVVDTPGFASKLDNRGCYKPLIDYLQEQHRLYLNNAYHETGTEMIDTRVHCCLYFISPTGHGLEPLDVESMKHLSRHVNLVPVICKSDCFTKEEIQQFKQQIRLDLAKHKITTFLFQDQNNPDVVHNSKHQVPFAVAGSNHVIQTNDGRRIRVRQYPWGCLEIENPEHCDTFTLRSLLVQHFIFDLIDSTHKIHYVNYRSECFEKGLISRHIIPPQATCSKVADDNTIIHAMVSADETTICSDEYTETFLNYDATITPGFH